MVGENSDGLRKNKSTRRDKENPKTALSIAKVTKKKGTVRVKAGKTGGAYRAADISGA